MDYLGVEKLVEKPTGEKRMLLVYFEAINVGQVLGKRKQLPLFTSGMVRYGSDPIPSINLYGNPDIEFSNVGGEGTLSAVATYDTKTKTLSPVPRSKVADTINALTKAESKMQKVKKP